MRPAKILMVEDNPADIALARQAMARAHVLCELEVAEHGLDAQDMLQGGYTPDLILLDLNMPVMDGPTFLEWIKSDSRFSAIPVVILTTSGNELDINTAWSRQCSAYIQKPVSLQGLADSFRVMSQFYFAIAQLPTGSAQS